MKRLLAGVSACAAALLALGCAGSPDFYPGTDIAQVSGFELRRADSIQKSGGVILAGTLEYFGDGNLTEVFQEYILEMGELGWSSASDQIDEKKAVGTMRKDNRTCNVSFVLVDGDIQATIQVSQTQ